MPQVSRVHLVDGTYELFRHFFAVPSSKDEAGVEIGATRGVVRSVLSMIEGAPDRRPATHLGVATDHVIESFRNDLWPGYKTGAGVAPELLAQFPILEEAIDALGVTVWPMIEHEADDALATAAAQASEYAEQVLICTPDKDLSQCVVDGHVVQLERRTNKLLDEAAVIAKFGVAPSSIADYLALVGDSADGFPGLPGWGARSAATVLAKFHHLEDIPAKASEWKLPLRNGPALAATLREQNDLAILFKDLATLRTAVDIDASEGALRWTGPRRTFKRVAQRFGAPDLVEHAERLANRN
jgi:5'-3' exonuclease